jgi:hypothetical protein
MWTMEKHHATVKQVSFIYFLACAFPDNSCACLFCYMRQ